MKRLSELIAIELVTLLSSIIFFGVSVWLLLIDKPLQAILSLIIGLILLSTSLAILREHLTQASE
ncbi:MAG: hypothetical protein ABWW65_05520 [Thermoprotei archaeon]